ncbi:MAG: YqgE/AlgH family protein, partial [Hyphomicrobiales bacterium]|nr:YqgE/AlgH family protein [Hyphomicrobiales bacterium]
MDDANDNLKSDEAPYLDGQLLVAMPSMPDERFARTVIYMCAHSEEGAMGIVINKKSKSVTFP